MLVDAKQREGGVAGKKEERGVKLVGEQQVVIMGVEELAGGQNFLHVRTTSNKGVFLSGPARGRLADVAKLTPGTDKIFVLCNLGRNPVEAHRKDTPFVVIETFQLIALIRVDGQRLEIFERRAWVQEQRELITRFLAGEDVEGAGKEPAAPAAAAATTAATPPANGNGNGNGAELRVPRSLVAVVQDLWNKVCELAVVSQREEDQIRDAVNGLGLQILSDDDRRLAETLVEQARATIVARKKEEGIKALQEQLETIPHFYEEIAQVIAEVPVPLITVEGVSYSLHLVTTTLATAPPATGTGGTN